MIISLLFALSMLASTFVHAADLETPAANGAATEDLRWAGNLEMNGYKLNSFGDFEKEWRLVTVRYRTDSGEFRFIYANPLAWKTLAAGKTDYPDGAVFAKSAYLLSNDPSFTSSLLPNKVARYQLMVRNKAKFKDTSGWGYALFDPAGRTFPGEPKAVSQSCAACHNIVADKGHVFGVPFNAKGSPLVKTFAGPQFETLAISSLPAPLVAQLPKGTTSVRSIQGSMRKNLFYGTLDEIRPFLASEVLKANQPAVLMNEDGSKFSAVFRDAGAAAECKSGMTAGVPMMSVLTTTQGKAFGTETAYAPSGSDGSRPLTHEFCFAK